MSLLCMKDICKSFNGIPVLKQVQLTIEKGEVHALLGENGAGKSTLMNILAGVFPADSGEVEINEKKIRKMTIQQSEKLGIAFVHQELNLFNDLKVYENIFLMKEYKKKTGALDKKRMIRETQQLFTELGVEIEPEEKVENLKTSQKQLLEISKALFFQAKLLILDEPTNGLDPAGIQEMRALIRNMPAATGATVLISSHLLGEMEQMVEQVGIIDHGHILFEGPLTELQRHSRGNVTLRLLDPAKAAPILRANGLTAHSDSCVVTLPPLQDALLADLVQKLAACGAGVVELTPHTKTLEEIFLSLTSEEAD